MNFRVAPNVGRARPSLAMIVAAIPYKERKTRTLSWFNKWIISRINMGTDFEMLETCVLSLRYQVADPTEMMIVVEAIRRRIEIVQGEHQIVVRERQNFQIRQTLTENRMFSQFFEDRGVPPTEVAGVL